MVALGVLWPMARAIVAAAADQGLCATPMNILFVRVIALRSYCVLALAILMVRRKDSTLPLLRAPASLAATACCRRTLIKLAVSTRAGASVTVDFLCSTPASGSHELKGKWPGLRRDLARSESQDSRVEKLFAEKVTWRAERQEIRGGRGRRRR